jgi:hypothetical protein
LIAIVIIASILLAIALPVHILHSLPWILHKPAIYSMNLELGDLPAIAISDFHIGSDRTEFREALKILVRARPRTLIITGRPYR